MIKSDIFLLDNIYASLGNKVYEQVVGIPIGTNYAPLITDLFVYSYESQLLAKFSKNQSKN